MTQTKFILKSKAKSLPSPPPSKDSIQKMKTYLESLVQFLSTSRAEYVTKDYIEREGFKMGHGASQFIVSYEMNQNRKTRLLNEIFLVEIWLSLHT